MVSVVVASDKFKGTLSSAEVAAAVGDGVLRALPEASVGSVVVADGGDGTLAAAVAAGFSFVPVKATGPTGEPVESGFARRGEVAVVELADVSGLIRLPGAVPAPMTATSRGTGELVAAAIDSGCTRVILGIGGSASTDGGAGLVRALGARLLDADGNEVAEGGAALTRSGVPRPNRTQRTPGRSRNRRRLRRRQPLDRPVRRRSNLRPAEGRNPRAGRRVGRRPEPLGRSRRPRDGARRHRPPRERGGT